MNEVETRNELVNVFTYVVIADRTDVRDNLRMFLTFDLKLHSLWNMKNNILQIVSYNCQGLNSVEKLRDVFDYLKSKNCNIYCLQDTHFTKNDETAIKNQWGEECIFNSFASNQRGVAILLSNYFGYKY